MDFKNMGAKKVAVVTDETVDKLDAMKQVREGLTREGVQFEVFSNVRCEPKDSSSVHLYASDIFKIANCPILVSRRPLSGLVLTMPTPSSQSAVAPSWTLPSS